MPHLVPLPILSTKLLDDYYYGISTSSVNLIDRYSYTVILNRGEWFFLTFRRTNNDYL